MHHGKGRRCLVHPGEQLSPRAVEGADVGAMIKPVVADGGRRRPDLAGQALRRDMQVAEGRGHVADFVAPGVAHVEREVTAR